MNFQKEKEGKQEREDLVHPVHSAQIWGHFTLCLIISQKKTKNCSTISDSHLDNKRLSSQEGYQHARMHSSKGKVDVPI
jgi:hypothetical protein